jgi:hypothetical protein
MNATTLQGHPRFSRIRAAFRPIREAFGRLREAARPSPPLTKEQAWAELEDVCKRLNMIPDPNKDPRDQLYDIWWSANR